MSGEILQKYWKASAAKMEFLLSSPKASSMFSQIILQATHPICSNEIIQLIGEKKTFNFRVASVNF